MSKMKEIEMVEHIVQGTNIDINNFADVDGTLKKYGALQVLFMEIILEPSSPVIYSAVCATIHHHEAVFIENVLTRKCCSSEMIDPLTRRMHNATYMHFEFNKRYVLTELEESVVIDKSDQTAVMNIKSLPQDVYSRVLKIMKNIASEDAKWNSIENTHMVANIFAMACLCIAKGYYTGIKPRLSIDKKLATYYQFISYDLFKTYGDKMRDAIYRDLFDMYMDALSDSLTMDIAILSLTKLKTLDMNVRLAHEKRTLYTVATTLMQSKPFRIYHVDDRVHSASECVACGAKRKLKTCAQCKIARFCNGNCMRMAWPIHKSVCKKWAAERAGASS
jgi:hypothetical protein